MISPGFVGIQGANFGADLWTPIELGSALDVWHDAADRSTQTPTTGVGVPVSQWRDKSGNLNHLDQGAGASQPITGSMSLSGLNVLDFSTSKDMDYTSVWTPGGITVFQVSNISSSNPSVSIYGISGTDLTFIPLGQDGSGAGGAARIDGSSIASVDVYISGEAQAPITTRGTMYDAIAQGAYRVTSISGFSASIEVIGIGTPGSAISMDGTMAESCIVSGSMTSGDMDKMNGYLSWKWDGGTAGTLVGLLPPGHTYKSAPPLV